MRKLEVAAIEDGKQDTLLLHWGHFRKSALATRHMSHEVVLFTIEPLTHRFLDDMVSVDLPVLLHLERGENVISSIDSSEAATHQGMDQAGDPRSVLPSATIKVR